jgi:hypothetical protein
MFSKVGGMIRGKRKRKGEKVRKSNAEFSLTSGV